MRLDNSIADTEAEKGIVKEFCQAILDKQSDNKLYWLKSPHTHVNLAGQNFKGIWSKWWTSQPPPLLEVDLVLVFEDKQRLIDEALLVAVEVKYFRMRKGMKNFYTGLQQALASAIFGFDGLSLWHLFSNSVPDEVVVTYANAIHELINGFRLPIFYVACKITHNSRLTCFSPLRVPEERGIDQLVNSCLSYFRKQGSRNPLLEDDQVRNRRKVLKVALEVPA